MPSLRDRPYLALACILAVAALLRLPRLDRLPNGFIPDEALSAYDAFSIARTGRDAAGVFLPLFPRSSAHLHCLNTYLVLPLVAWRGLDEWSARLPSALAGIATVALTFGLVRRDHGVAAALVAALLLAISPWHALTSRTGYDWNLLPAMSTLTAVLVLGALDRRRGWSIAGLAAGVSFYTYAPIRLWLPILLAGILLLNLGALVQSGRRSLVGAALAVALALPVVVESFASEGRERLASILPTGSSSGAGFSGFLRRYASSFAPQFLLRRAGRDDLHRLSSTGLVYEQEIPLVIAGIAAVLAARSPRATLPLLWLLAAPLAVCIHKDAPDPVLSLGMLPGLQALGGIGAVWLWERARRFGHVGSAAALAFSLSFAFSAGRMADDLYRRFPVYGAETWGYGAREMISAIEALRRADEDVLVDPRQKLMGPLILFYTGYDPATRQAETAGQTARAERSHVASYRIGPLPRAVQEGGRHLVWTTPEEGRRLFPAVAASRRVPLPDGRELHALFEIEGSRR